MPIADRLNKISGVITKPCSQCGQVMTIGTLSHSTVVWACSCGHVETAPISDFYANIRQYTAREAIAAEKVAAEDYDVAASLLHKINQDEITMRHRYLAAFNAAKTGGAVIKIQWNTSGRRICPVCGSSLLVYSPGLNGLGYTLQFVCSNGWETESKTAWCGYSILSKENPVDVLQEYRTRTPKVKILHTPPRCPECSGLLVLHPLARGRWKSRWFCTTGQLSDISFCGYEQLNEATIGDILSFVE